MLNPLFNSYDIRASSDYWPILDYQSVLTRFLRSSALDLTQLCAAPLPLAETFDFLAPRSAPLNISKNLHFRIASQARQTAAAVKYFGSLQAGKSEPLLTEAPALASAIGNIKRSPHIVIQLLTSTALKQIHLLNLKAPKT